MPSFQPYLCYRATRGPRPAYVPRDSPSDAGCRIVIEDGLKGVLLTSLGANRHGNERTVQVYGAARLGRPDRRRSLAADLKKNPLSCPALVAQAQTGQSTGCAWRSFALP
jgi:hypothetical protein